VARTLYEILEIAPTASPEVIKSAYRALAAKFHPDRNVSNDGDAFKLVSKAYEILSNPDKRADYDLRLIHGEESLFLGVVDSDATKSIETVKRRNGSDTWCTIDEHVRRKGAELAETNLQGLQLSNLSLEGATLSGADLSHSSMQSVNLSKANLDSVICRNSKFHKVDFKYASFAEAVFENCVFEECDLNGCALQSGAFRACDFRGSSMVQILAQDVDFSHSTFEGVCLAACLHHDYETPIQRRNRFVNCKFNQCNLRNTIFGYHKDKTDNKASVAYLAASFIGCDFTKANLENANAVESYFEDCAFAGASLASAKLKESHVLRPRSFSETSLYGADFTNAEIVDADFRTCNVINARFHGAKRKNVLFPDGFVPPSSERVLEPKANNGCFIATACCGRDSVEVRDLRAFRDAVLLQSRGGKFFVQQYYRLSPPIANFLEVHPLIADCVRRSAIVPLHRFVRKHHNHSV